MDEGTALLVNLIGAVVGIAVLVLLIVGWVKLYSAIISAAESLRAIRTIAERREKREAAARAAAAIPRVLDCPAAPRAAEIRTAGGVDKGVDNHVRQVH